MLLAGEEIPEHQYVSPEDISDIQQTSLAYGITLGKRDPEGLQM